MYEKPQYFTPDGFRRSSGNPFKPGIPYSEAVKRLAEKNMSQGKTSESSDKQTGPLTIKPHIARFLKMKEGSGTLPQKKQPVISEEAARLIANAIKGLLRS